ncbi:MAG TPA: Gfo/Idh/MocA family oxidoreductase [Terriglobales bacterium]|nr:Gfo/Idh/MocA family oxidoreductase [Terriglobales bacterium]
MKAAVIGIGFVGRAHVEALRRLNIPIVGLLGRSTERTEEACRHLGVPRAYSSLAELASDSTSDVVHVCTPNHLHFEQAVAVLRAGKHVMCEKPLAMNVGEAAGLVELAQSQRRVGAVAYNLRYYPLCQEAKVLIDQGVIGEPNLVHGGFLQDWLFYPTDWNWRLEPELGGDLRAVADIGTHWLDLVTWLTGRKVREVCADLATVIPLRKRPRGRVETFQTASTASVDDVTVTTDDYASVLLRFEKKLRGVMTVSQVSAGHKAQLSFEINGAEGSLAWNSESPNQLWLGRRNEASRVLPKDPTLMNPKSRDYASYPGGHAEGYPDTFVQLFRDFYRYLQVGDFTAVRSFPTFETGRDELALCQAILLSSNEGRWVPVP